MAERKRYVKPAVESEEATEQTSLACNITIIPPGDGQACSWGENLHSQIDCEIIPFKGGNFSSGLPECPAIPLVEQEECYVALS